MQVGVVREFHYTVHSLSNKNIERCTITLLDGGFTPGDVNGFLV
jgi:hypothetical protein